MSLRKKDSPDEERGEIAASEWLVAGERSKAEAWRLHVLMVAGYPLAIAERLAMGTADLHVACEILKSGCTPEVAADILL